MALTGPIINTPRGCIVVNQAGTKAKLEWNGSRFHGGSGSWQGHYTRAQKFVDSEILRLSEPFTPLRTGMLVMSGTLGTEIGSGLVQWIAPYAKQQYYGGRKPGESQTGPLRGKFWFERMKQVHGRDIIAGARRLAGGK
jgi:hypothetical protein